MGEAVIDYNAVPFGRGSFRTYGKDNDYTYYKYFLLRPRDGSHPERDAWHYCVRQGVLSIQGLLQRAGFAQDATGVYGRTTRRNIRLVQEEHNLTSEGVCGPYTMQVLMRPVIESTSAFNEIDPKYIHAFCSLESGYDPGAQGIDHPTDLGLFQHNISDTDTADYQAWDPDIACQITAERFKKAQIKYSGQGPDLRLSCSIAQHNWPEGADIWFDTGEPPTPAIAGYVNLVLDRSETW